MKFYASATGGCFGRICWVNSDLRPRASEMLASLCPSLRGRVVRWGAVGFQELRLDFQEVSDAP